MNNLLKYNNDYPIKIFKFRLDKITFTNRTISLGKMGIGKVVLFKDLMRESQ